MRDVKSYFAMNRRHFLTGSAAMAACSILPVNSLFAAGSQPPFGGVAVGAISYSFRELPSGADKVLEYLVACGLNSVELMGTDAEQFAGSPAGGGFGALFAGAPPVMVGGMPQFSEEQRAAMAKANDEQAKWRQSVDMNKYRQLRKLYDDAGISIDILKLGEASWADADIDYAYNVAKILGARGISFELGDEAAQRLGTFATKHEMYNGMHNHEQYGQAGFSADPMLAYSSYNMLNFDIGHYVGSTGKSPTDFIGKYHDRITHLHLKDRQTPANGGANLAWGQGDTPIAEVLQLLQKEKYQISAMIELEYKVPEDSDVLTEMKKCADYCRDALG